MKPFTIKNPENLTKDLLRKNKPMDKVMIGKKLRNFKDIMEEGEKIRERLPQKEKDLINIKVGMAIMMDELLDDISDKISHSDDVDSDIFLSHMKTYMINFINTNRYTKYLEIMKFRSMRSNQK